MQTHKPVFDPVLHQGLEFNGISPSRRIVISDLHFKAIRKAPIIVISVSSTAETSMRTFDLRPIAADEIIVLIFTFLVDGILEIDLRT
jgi:hypothetical protein